MPSDLGRYLHEEFARLAPTLAAMEGRIRDFWAHPATPALGLWGVPPPAARPAPPYPGGTPTERYLHDQLVAHIRPAIEAHGRGFLTVPTLLPHTACVDGPFPQSHLVAAALGARITDTGDPLAVGAEPLIHDLAELPRLEALDVTRSPLLQGLCRAIVEMAEITQGAIAVEPYLQHGPLDLAAGVIGTQAFYELTVLDPEGAARLIGVCADQWLAFRQAQERAAGGRWAGRRFEPGCYVGDSLLENLPPNTIRELALPVAARLAGAYGGVVVGIGRHPDASLLTDIAAVPGFRGAGVPLSWPPDAVAAALAGKGVLHMGYAGYPGAPDWTDCLNHARRLRHRVRLLANICPMHCRCFFKETDQELRDRFWRQGEEINSTL